MLTSKGHMVTLNEEEFSLAHQLGMGNLSEFVRDAISYYISNTDRELTASEVRELSKRFALEKRAALLKQQKISGQTDEEIAKIEELKAQRRARIAASVQKEMNRIGTVRFKRYMDDPYGDYAKMQDDCIEAISQDAGMPVQLCDVLEALKAVP